MWVKCSIQPACHQRENHLSENHWLNDKYERQRLTSSCAAGIGELCSRGGGMNVINLRSFTTGSRWELTTSATTYQQELFPRPAVHWVVLPVRGASYVNQEGHSEKNIFSSDYFKPRLRSGSTYKHPQEAADDGGNLEHQVLCTS